MPWRALSPSFFLLVQSPGRGLPIRRIVFLPNWGNCTRTIPLTAELPGQLQLATHIPDKTSFRATGLSGPLQPKVGRIGRHVGFSKLLLPGTWCHGRMNMSLQEKRFISQGGIGAVDI